MPKKVLTIILFFISSQTIGQTAHIDTKSFYAKDRFNERNTYKLKYPIIKTGKKRVDSLINVDIKNKYTRGEYLEDPIDSAINKYISDGMVDINFTTTYNKHGFLSFYISSEWMGAYPSYWNTYFNYSTVTGLPLSINLIVDTAGSFRTMVIKQKNIEYGKCFKMLKADLLDSSSGLDNETYEAVADCYETDSQSFNLKLFSLYPDYLEIIHESSLPHGLLPYTPDIQLKFKYQKIKQFLKNKTFLAQ